MAGLFGWLGGNKEENNPPVGSDEGGIPGSSLRVEGSASAKEMEEAQQRRNKKPESGKRAFSLEDDDGKKASPELQQQIKALEDLFDPKVWRGAVGAPGDAMYAITGREHWKISDDERDTLAKTGAATARCFAVTDPKWLALSLFLFSVTSIYGGRVLKDVMDRAAQKEAMRAKAPTDAQFGGGMVQ